MTHQVADFPYAKVASGATADLLQINIRIPEDRANRPNLPLILEIGEVRSPAGVTLPCLTSEQAMKVGNSHESRRWNVGW